MIGNPSSFNFYPQRRGASTKGKGGKGRKKKGREGTRASSMEQHAFTREEEKKKKKEKAAGEKESHRVRRLLSSPIPETPGEESETGRGRRKKKKRGK